MEFVHAFGLIAVALISTASALHALLNKPESTAAFAWIAVCVLFPVVGPVLYFLLGINRIRTRARALRAEEGAAAPHHPEEDLSAVPDAFVQQARISRAVTGLPLTRGNRIEPLHDGDQTYPAMLDSIRAAKQRVFLSTYIFESNITGQAFADELGDAVRRGVDVRVLLDGAGELYSFPLIRHRLRREGVQVARFLPPRLLPPRLLLNLRNHRKILVVDGNVAFTGGMNIGDRHIMERTDGKVGVRDIQFRFHGPIVSQMEAVFLDDWRFATGEDQTMPSPPPPSVAPDALCRAIADGPNEDLNRLLLVLTGAVAAARGRIAIATPYFLPSRELIGALQAAAVRGIDVDVLLPGRNNLPFMHWATRHMLWDLVRWGVRVHYRSGPFMHAKLFVVDGHYAQVGSANIDTRSLRLNFEMNIEVHDVVFARALTTDMDAAIADAAEVTLTDLEQRSFPTRVRDAVCWLFQPYL